MLVPARRRTVPTSHRGPRSLGKTNLDPNGGLTWPVLSPAAYFSCTQRPERSARTSSGRQGACSVDASPLTGSSSPPRPACSGRSTPGTVSYTHLRAHETVLDLVCRLLLEKKK